MIGVNLSGVFLCMNRELPLMLATGGGAIVNTSSTYGLVGAAGLPAYVASKSGVAGLTRAAALEYAEQGVRVNAVCPGPIQTPMIDRVSRELSADDPQSAEAELAAHTPLGRLGQPSEIGAAVAWLCSAEASYVTGLIMPVDGGWTTV